MLNNIYYIILIYLLDGSITNRVSRVSASTASPRAASSVHNTNSYQSSRRNSVDSLDESTPNFRDFRVWMSCVILNISRNK